MNRPLPARGRHRRADPGRPSRLARVVPRAGGLIGGSSVDQGLAAHALNVIKHGGFERGRTNPALPENVAPLETLCATSVRMEEIVGQCS